MARTSSRRLPAGLAWLVAATLASPASTAAQPQQQPERPRWADDVSLVAVNGILGGVTAGLTAWIRGEDVARAFLGGTGGGGILWLGKRVTSDDVTGAGWLGREIGAVGSSVIANAGAGRGLLESVWLPIGPVWLQVSPSSPRTARVDAYTVAALGWALSRPELELDLEGSLSAGAFVFRSPRHAIRNGDGPVLGIEVGGLMLLGPAPAGARVRAHESVHVVQYDFWLHAVSRPLERWAWNRLLGREVPVDLAIVTRFHSPFSSLVEWEADLFENR